MTLALVFACVATRRSSGAVLAAVATPAAIGLTEYVLKPSIGQAIEQSFPSGHATSMFALAATCAVLLVDPPRRRVPGVARLLLVLMALLLAVAVAAAMVAIGAHNFTDAVAGAAVGTGVVLACALILDLVMSRARRAPAARSLPGGDRRRADRSDAWRLGRHQRLPWRGADGRQLFTRTPVLLTADFQPSQLLPPHRQPGAESASYQITA
jgi:membrane-associated phospholipid phosphatase